MSRTTYIERIYLSENIRRLRENRGWSRRKLAGFFQPSNPSVKSWEQPIASMNLDTLQKLADIFEVKMADLLKSPKETHTPTTITYAKNKIKKGSEK